MVVLFSLDIFIDRFVLLTDVLSNGADDFEDSSEVFEAVGDILQEVANNKSEDDIRNICDRLWKILKPDTTVHKHQHKVLNAPVNLGSMAANLENNVDEIKSIWVIQRDETLVRICRFSTAQHL